MNHRSLILMAYRRTENVIRRLAEREQTILDAARSIAGEGGMGAVQIAAVAQRADIAAGTVYRYFPSKNDLVADVIAATAERELAAIRAAADAAPGPLSALAACMATFAARALQERRLAWAVMAEPVDADIDALRLDFRRALAAELEKRISTAVAGGHLPDQDPRVAAPAVIGALLEGLVGPLAPSAGSAREAVQTITLLALRALGVVDARARGLIAQCVLP
jgi:AcrR family transcriptional regulator